MKFKQAVKTTNKIAQLISDILEDPSDVWFTVSKDFDINIGIDFDDSTYHVALYPVVEGDTKTETSIVNIQGRLP